MFCTCSGVSDLLVGLDLGVGQLVDLFQHLLRRDAVREFAHHHLPLAARQLFDRPACAHLQRAASGQVAVADVAWDEMICPPPGKSGP